MTQFAPPAPVQWRQPASESAPALPVEPRAYHQFWRAPRLARWKMVLLLVLVVVLFLALQVVALLAAILVDDATGRRAAEAALEDLGAGKIVVTPAFFLANNVCLALLIPVSWLASRLFTAQRSGWLASVVGSFRWGWFARCVAVLLPVWLVQLAIEFGLSMASGEELGLHVNRDTWLLAAGILFTTPFQCAGEEYGFRGILNRASASFVRHEKAALVVGALFSSVLFMLAHAAGDLWLNLFYLCFGLVACYMTWRTGGLEAAIAMHVINNVVSEATLPFSDISSMFDREAGAGDPTMLLGIAFTLIGLALVEWQARRQHVLRTSAPGAPAPALARGQVVLPGSPTIAAP